MPLNAFITIGLIGALALVLLARRSMAGKANLPTSRNARALRARLGRKRREPVDAPAAPRLRPRLAMTVPEVNQSTDSPDLSSEQESPDPETPDSASTPPAEHLDSLWDDVEPPPAATQTSTASLPEVDDVTPLVDAPGWPSPGELVGMFSLDELDPLPPALDQTSQPDPVDADSVDVFGRMPPQSTDLWRDLDDPTEDAAPALIGAMDDEPVLAAVAVTWDPVETQEAAQDQAEPAPAEWTSQDWSFEGRDDFATSESWGAPNVVPDMPVPEASQYADDDWSRPQTDTATIDDVSEWQTPPAPVASHPITIETAAAGATQAPIVVVLTPEILNLDRPSRREIELEKAVHRLEKKLAALSAATPARPNRSQSAKSTTTRAQHRSPQAAVAKAPFTLTAAERRTLQALAARRTAPLAARRRARIILRSARGLSTKTIAAQVGVAESTVRRWQARFAADRLAALDRDLRPGTRAGR